MTNEFTKSERRLLDDLADKSYETEARIALADLAAQFDAWRVGDLGSADLIQAIHVFHQGGARDLWSMYQSFDRPDIVMRGLALGYLQAADVPTSLREKLETRPSLLRKTTG